VTCDLGLWRGEGRGWVGAPHRLGGEAIMVVSGVEWIAMCRSVLVTGMSVSYFCLDIIGSMNRVD
jgi:hypothetical protein